MTTPVGSRSGNGYWGGQIGSTALLGVGCLAASVVMLVAGSDEPGGAVLLGFAGILFLTTFAWAVDAATRSTRQERALFAWAIAQHEAAGHGNDALALADAARARDGELDGARIQALQAFRPANPYPAEMPGADAQLIEKQAPVKDRLGAALVALDLALTGLYFSCMPPVFIFGWPYQVVAAILAVIAIRARGRGRRLGVVAAIVTGVGFLVTIVMMAVRIAGAAG
jgi:hypothetical protein